MGLLDFLNPLSIITGPLEKITDAITQVQIAKAKAQTDKDKIAADERLHTLEAKRDVLIAESGDKVNRLVRALLALPVAIFLTKVLVFDIAFGQWTGWTTSQPSDQLWIVINVVVGFYFIDNMVARLKR